VNGSQDAILKTVKNSPHSFFPVGDGSIDEILGVVKSKDILHQLISSSSLDLRSILREAVLIPESASAFEAMEVLRKGKSPVALVIDEYGGLDGLVTLTDLLHAIVGGVSAANEMPAVVYRGDGSLLVDGMLPFEDFRKLLGQNYRPAGSKENYRTVAGFILSKVGRIPRASESFEWNGYRIEVVDLDGRRIDKVLAIPLPLPNEQGRND